MKRFFQVTSLIAIGVSTKAALAFNSDEHKMLGDVATSEIPVCGGAAYRNCRPIDLSTDVTTLMKSYDYHRDGQIAVVMRYENQLAFRNERYKYHKDNYDGTWWYNVKDAYIAKLRPPSSSWDPKKQIKPLLIWVGSASQLRPGAYFTFGDLVALYGDYRIPVTCDERSDECRLTDTLDQKTTKILGYLRGFAQGDVPPFGKIGNSLFNSGGDATNYAWWGDEMLRIGIQNDSHFTSQAVRWYVTMHRHALHFAKRAAEENFDERELWKALHYEANALHALTDLFAPGHNLVSREDTVHRVLVNKEGKSVKHNSLFHWRQNTLELGNGKQPFRALVSPKAEEGAAESMFNGFSYPAWSAIKSLFGIRNTVALRTRAEECWHSSFNQTGALVRNYYAVVEEKKETWNMTGDSDLFLTRGQGEPYPPIYTQDNWQIAKRATRDSLVAIFNAYIDFRTIASCTTGKQRKEALQKKLDELIGDPATYVALKSVPLQVRNHCYQRECYATKEWHLVPHYAQILAILKSTKRLNAPIAHEFTGSNSVNDHGPVETTCGSTRREMLVGVPPKMEECLSVF